MRKYLAVFLLAGALFGFAGCSSSGAAPKDAETQFSPEDAEISALGAVGRLEAAVSGPLYEGDGGKDLRLAVLAPSVEGAVPNYVPMYVQGLLNNNFKKYSGITLIDRQNLDKIIAEQDVAAKGRFSDADFVKIRHLTNAQYYLMGTIQKLSGEQYSLHLSISDSSTGERKANYMKNGTLREIEGSGALINEATADLLAQLGIQLTDAGKQSLITRNIAVVRAETGLAKGITAQASGAPVEALFNYTESIAFDSSQIETLTRLSMLSSSISGGSIGDIILNDIQTRDRWFGAFKEAARFFDEHPPFEITFDPNLIQEGETDYVKRTANLAMRVALDPSDAGFAALNALLKGLEETGRRRTWGFSGWPLLDINPQTPGTVVFGGKRSFSFKLDAALLNENRKILGTSSVTLNSGTMKFSSGDKKITAPGGAFDLMWFSNVKADDLTPILTIVITGVNGIPSRTLNAAGYMRIDTGDLEAQQIEAARISQIRRQQQEADRIRQQQEAARVARILASFVSVQGGTFTMGSPRSEPGRSSDEVQHQVTVSSFYMGKYEVTQKEYQEVMGSNPSYFKGDNLPVENVSWYDAVEYCNKRSVKEGLTSAYTINGSYVSWNRNANGYRLPTEAEWEYACRAGTTTPYYTGNSVGGAGWYKDNSGGQTHPVGEKRPNPWGLYDMHGNVWEWCWDWYGSYSAGAQTDPVGASSGSLRVFRGGSWGSNGLNLRSAYRLYNAPTRRYYYLGFRLLRPSS